MKSLTTLIVLLVHRLFKLNRILVVANEYVEVMP